MATPEPSPATDLIRAEIRAVGPVSFARFMALCLYHPAHGYYSGGAARIGRGGDFFTSVSVGPAFGELMADHFCTAWEELDRPARFTIFEQGAHDGRLSADVLGRIESAMPEFFRAVHYGIIEPLPLMKNEQSAQLASWASRVEWFDDLDRAATARRDGILFANELLDAFPVHRARFDGARWHELLVALDDAGQFVWHEAGFTNDAARRRIEGLGPDYPAGYTTEVCPAAAEWITTAARVLTRGAILVIDYGREAADYYAPGRTNGTLRGYRAHRRCDDPFLAPGEMDLTADVDFTFVREAAVAAGLTASPLDRQERFLTRIAKRRFAEIESRGPCAAPARWLHQFRTLTHPGLMGQGFYVQEFRKPV